MLSECIQNITCNIPNHRPVVTAGSAVANRSRRWEMQPQRSEVHFEKDLLSELQDRE